MAAVRADQEALEAQELGVANPLLSLLLAVPLGPEVPAAGAGALEMPTGVMGAIRPLALMDRTEAGAGAAVGLHLRQAMPAESVAAVKSRFIG